MEADAIRAKRVNEMMASIEEHLPRFPDAAVHPAHADGLPRAGVAHTSVDGADGTAHEADVSVQNADVTLAVVMDASRITQNVAIVTHAPSDASIQDI